MTSPVKETPERGVRAAHRASASANWGTFFGWTKLVTSIRFTPAARALSMRASFCAVETGLASFCSPSRGLTSMSAVMVRA